MRRRRANVVTPVETLRAMRATDARNAGYRRGVEGRAPGGTYQHRDEFKAGYAEGVADRNAINREEQ